MVKNLILIKALSKPSTTLYWGLMHKNSQKDKLGVYYVGATIADSRVLEIVRTSQVRASCFLGLPLPHEEKLGECHITLLPPFFATYEEASALNLALMCSTINSSHPLTLAQFKLGKMSRMMFAEMVILHYAVTVLEDQSRETSFMSWVTNLRQKVTQFEGFNWRDTIPSKFYPHITVISTQDEEYKAIESGILWNTGLAEFINEQRMQTPNINFVCAYPTVYAKYRNTGWQSLSSDPASTFL